MDTGKGRFEQIEVKLGEAYNEEELKHKIGNLEKMYPGHGGVFREGEIVELKGSKFQISKIISNGLKLKLLPK